MRRWRWLTGGVLFLLTALLLKAPWQSQAQQARDARWIWFNEGEPASQAPAETRYFRKTFDLKGGQGKVVDQAGLELTADNSFTVWVNGVQVGSGEEWNQLHRFDVARHLRQGANVLAVEAGNSGGPAGLVVRLTYTPTGQAKTTLVSNSSWKASQNPAQGWQKPGFDDSRWSAAKELGPLGMAPWGNQSRGDGPKVGQFKVPDGFRVEPVVVKPTDRGPFSIVNMTFDNRGRLLLSQEGGPILLCVDADERGVSRKVAEYCKQVKNAHGMCWVRDALYLVGDGPQGTGLYRCTENQAGDAIDRVELVHRFKGGMGEHGPHAVVHGPDNMLYLVIGNHAFAQPEKLADTSPLTRWPRGTEGPDQGKPGSTEDVLLPYLEDARGHAVGRRAPGGTIWRLDPGGKNMALFSACFRNQFDAAFSPAGELFTFDSDMEWDEALPWYRPVRICHCPPGADFGWRSGAANHPPYYFDSLPATVDTGRGSPVGVEFYDHHTYPEKYRGVFFAADWAIGTIYAVSLEKKGGTFKGKAEKFCSGSPMNVTDCEVGPDGLLYFTLGGRGTQGGVFRVVHEAAKEKASTPVAYPQPLSAWGRARDAKALAEKAGGEGGKQAVVRELLARVQDDKVPASERVRLLTVMHLHDFAPPVKDLAKLVEAKDAGVRAQAVYYLGVRGGADAKQPLLDSLVDEDRFVQRRACESLIRAGIEPDPGAISPLLNDEDLFVRTAARLVLQRIDPKKWTDRLWNVESGRLVREGIMALCKTGQADAHAEPIFTRLHQGHPEEAEPLLDHLRTLQMALIHTKKQPGGTTRGIALDCVEMFPHKDSRVNRELALLLVYFQREKVLDEPVQGKLLAAVKEAKADRAQQIHYAYCLRLLHSGWTAAQKEELLTWYEGTRAWSGGHSFTPFLENIIKDLAPAFTKEERLEVLRKADRLPLSALVLLRSAPDAQLPTVKELGELFEAAGKLPVKEAREMKEALVLAAGRHGRPEGHEAMLRMAGTDPALRDMVLRSVAAKPQADDWKLLVGGLESQNKQVLFDVMTALRKLPAKPKAEEAAPFRAVLLASTKLDPQNRWRAVELLRHWTNDRQFGADDRDWRTELGAWAKWFVQSFPREPVLPNVAEEKPAESKYKFDELLAFLEKEGRQGDVARGRAAFEKGQCFKCHKYGNEGEGIGPDLTTLSKRFKRSDTLEAMFTPSKVISDQYRSTLIVTKAGQQVIGLAAPMGDTVTVLQQDGTKTVIKKGDIDQQFSSLVSVMPEKLLDQLTKQEIADLFAFLESEPKK